jgi:hypothetical protein
MLQLVPHFAARLTPLPPFTSPPGSTCCTRHLPPHEVLQPSHPSFMQVARLPHMPAALPQVWQHICCSLPRTAPVTCTRRARRAWTCSALLRCPCSVGCCSASPLRPHLTCTRNFQKVPGTLGQVAAPLHYPCSMRCCSASPPALPVYTSPMHPASLPRTPAAPKGVAGRPPPSFRLPQMSKKRQAQLR